VSTLTQNNLQKYKRNSDEELERKTKELERKRKELEKVTKDVEKKEREFEKRKREHEDKERVSYLTISKYPYITPSSYDTMCALLHSRWRQ
jgi:hypothetical protein